MISYRLKELFCSIVLEYSICTAPFFRLFWVRHGCFDLNMSWSRQRSEFSSLTLPVFPYHGFLRIGSVSSGTRATDSAAPTSSSSLCHILLPIRSFYEYVPDMLSSYPWCKTRRSIKNTIRPATQIHNSTCCSSKKPCNWDESRTFSAVSAAASSSAF